MYNINKNASVGVQVKTEKENNNLILDNDIKKIISEIYTQMFCRFEEQYIIVFLCGGASSKGKKSLRDKIRVLLEKEKGRYYWQLPIKIFYPEDLLIEVLNKTKDADLLSYEQLLANNSNVIAIICESAGSLVELGAFTNNDYTVNKVIAAIDKKRTKDKSFIMMGPIKYLKKKNKLNVVEYGSDEQEFSNRLAKNIREKYIRETKNRSINLQTIVGMHYFVQLLLYFFKTLNSKELADIIHYVGREFNIDFNDFNVIFNAALKLLFQDKQIVKLTTPRYSSYQLTKKGYKSMEMAILDCTRKGVCDKIRIDIMYYKFYKSPRS